MGLRSDSSSAEMGVCTFRHHIHIYPIERLTGGGKEICLETRDEMVNIQKSCLDGDLGLRSDHVCATRLISTQHVCVQIIVHLLSGAPRQVRAPALRFAPSTQDFSLGRFGFDKFGHVSRQLTRRTHSAVTCHTSTAMP
jgi:hypothetical protein